MSSTASTAVHVTLPSAHHWDRILKTINRINYCIHVHRQVLYLWRWCQVTWYETACFSNCRCGYMEKLLQDMHVHMTESIGDTCIWHIHARAHAHTHIRQGGAIRTKFTFLAATVFYQRLWQGSCYQQMEGPFASLVPTMKLLSPRASSLHKIISRGTLKLLMGQFGQ